MLNRVRRFFDLLVYSGLKPDQRTGVETPPPSISDRLSALIERLFGAGRAPSDPLYLSRRTTLQKAAVAVLATAPLLLVGGLVALFLSGYFRPTAPPAPEPTAAREELPTPVSANTAKPDADILEIRLDGTAGQRVQGRLRNNTGHDLNVEMLIDLADENGSRIAVLKHVVQAAPPGSSDFSFPAARASAAYALVRQVRTFTSGSSR